MNTYIDIWSCQSSDLGTLQHYCTMLCGYFHSGPETRAHLSDCVNEQYRGLRAIYVCNRHGWLRAVSEYNSGSVCGSLLWTSTEHRLRTAGFRLLYFFKFKKCCFYVYCSALSRRPFVNPTEVWFFWHRLETEMSRAWDQKLISTCLLFLAIGKCI